METHAELAVTRFLPRIELPSAPESRPVALHPVSGQTTVLMSVHSATCNGCRHYLDSLAPSAGEFNVWDGRLLIAVPGSISESQLLHAPFGKVLADQGERISSPDNASLIVADRYGHIFEAVHAGGTHQLPAPRQLEEWLKFLGTLCPE
jgi:hypothetical protein